MDPSETDKDGGDTVAVADSILQNGILIDTSKGLFYMSLKDVLSSDLNLSAEDWQNIATQLLMQLPNDGTESEQGIINDAAPDIKTTPQQTAPPPSLKAQPPKRRGGWPKGRKRKTEMQHLPPKAPSTGYNLFLTERRKFYKGMKLAFHEVTKVVGNEWSNLSLTEKQPYLDRAEEEKKRYREELRVYRQSEAYQLYLAKKRRRRAQDNFCSESDMDATDEIDEEDNEELYCRTCDQWFHNLHNKREHLQSKQHQQAIAGDVLRELSTDDNETEYFISSTSLDESSLDGLPSNTDSISPAELNVQDAVNNIFSLVMGREKEIGTLKESVKQKRANYRTLLERLCELKRTEIIMRQELFALKDQQNCLEQEFIRLWSIPGLFDPQNTSESSDCVPSDTLTD